MGIAFSGERLDRAAERRTDPEWVAEQAASPRARAVLAGDAGIHVTADERLALLPLAQLDAREPLLLGLDETGPVFAVDADGTRSEGPVSAGDQRWTARGAIAAQGESPPNPATGTRAIGLRAAASTLPHADAGLAAHAAALVNWHRRHRHCSVCGAPTSICGTENCRSV